MGMAVVAATWGTSLALRFKTQSAAPLMQVGMLLLVLTTTAYAPLDLLTGWLQDVAEYNPVTQVVEAARQGFVGEVTWADTWPGLLALAGLAALFTFFALRGMRRMTDRVSRRPGQADRDRGADAARELDRGRAGRRPLRLRPGRARATTPGSGTGTRASTRSSGGASTPSAPSRSSSSLLDGGQRGRLHRPHDLLGPPVDLRRRWTYNVTSRDAQNTSTIQPPLLAWAWRIAVGDPAERAADRRPPPLARGATATSTATGCSGSSSPTSPGSTPRPSSTRSGAGAPTPTSASSP